MGKLLVFLAVGLIVLLSSTGEAFYQAQTYTDMPTYTPTTLEEVTNYLCQQKKGDKCVDESPAKIVINQVFDFTESEGTKTEVGCYHKSKPAQCFKIGQLKLNVVEQCNGLIPTNVTYSLAGKRGIAVGSNKIIVGENGGGLKGKGLRLYKSKNVEIRNLKITDINAQVIWGGDAIDLVNVENVLIDGNYIKNIGRQMIVSHFGTNTGIMISNNVFDGNTPYASHCNGQHYWLWLFLGESEQIALQNNVILNTSGRGPHLIASKNSKDILHMIQNTFYDIVDMGVIEVDDSKSSILVEGNVFVNVTHIVHKANGNIYMPQTDADKKACETPLGRECLTNTIVNSGAVTFKNSEQVLDDFKAVKSLVASPIDMSAHITSWVTLPTAVKQCVTDFAQCSVASTSPNRQATKKKSKSKKTQKKKSITNRV